MNPKAVFLPLILGALSGTESYASVGNATVVVVRGNAKTEAGKALKEQDKIVPGTTVVTGARSFVRLLFADQTQLNVGPDTTMKIEATKAGEASLVDLVGGEIRAKVTKDPHLAQDANGPVKEKMIVKTKTAAMGIRGTDFNVSFNELNQITALITFEGNVAMAKMEAGMNPLAALHQDKGVQAVLAGQFSGVQPGQPQASIPVKISPAQLASLQGNTEFRGLGERQQKLAVMASPIPPGVDPKAFASGSEKALKDTLGAALGSGKLDSALAADRNNPGAVKNAPPPEGFLNKKTGEYAPRAGGYVDLASGRYVPPPAGSSFDPNTSTFVPPRAMGSVDPNSGMYVPPKGVDFDPVKGFVAEKAPVPGTPGADNARGPSAAAPPSPATTALVAVLNTQATPEASTKPVTMDASLSGGSSIVSAASGAPATALPPPPPPPPPPAPTSYTDPVTTQPVSYNCATDNTCGGTTAPAPTSTGVTFHINVTD